MLLLTVVYDNEMESVINGINNVKEYFKAKNVIIGVSESIESNTHFVKIFCNEDINNRLLNLFNLHMASVLYEVVIDEFYKKDMMNFLSDTYFFLKQEEIKEIQERSMEVLKGKDALIDENSIYCINRKNAIIDKIVQCIIENKEININGFIIFRAKELKKDLESIIDKVVEKYMVEKEYNEFIKLLKYFVEIQESKIDELNIIIDNEGKYIIKDKNDVDIKDILFDDLKEINSKKGSNVEDLLISALITNSPAKIIIHCEDNCANEEFIDTIKKVFTDRVEFCNNCKTCKKIKQSFHKV